MSDVMEDKPKEIFTEVLEQPLGEFDGKKFFKYDQFISTGKAAKIAGVTMPTIRKWIQEYDIGWKIVGHWKVLPGRLNALLKRLEKDGEFPFDEKTLKKRGAKKEEADT